ncbi:hypothetical protein LUZ60_007076 [Juncus effusus]|nr:hypothetical protein LUZ60_007076 [Juncus effusus]
MSPGFARSISLPLSTGKSIGTNHHVRSVSLPCQSHPLIFHLQEKIRAVRSSLRKSHNNTAWISSCLSKIELLYSILDEFLDLTNVQSTLGQSDSTDNLLDASLLLADSHGSFLSVVLTLKHQQLELQTAFRHGDAMWMATLLKSQRQVEKELTKIASLLRNINKYLPMGQMVNSTHNEIFKILSELISTTSAASVAILLGFATFSSAIVNAASDVIKSKKSVCNEEKEMVVLRKFEDLEECLRNLESGAESMFRCLVKTRVSFLNICTPVI